MDWSGHALLSSLTVVRQVNCPTCKKVLRGHEADVLVLAMLLSVVKHCQPVMFVLWLKALSMDYARAGILGSGFTLVRHLGHTVEACMMMLPPVS